MECLQALAGADAHYVTFAFNLGNSDSGFRFEVVKFLSRKVKVDAPRVDAVFFKFKRLPASLSISNGFCLNGYFDSSINFFLSNMNTVNAIALLKFLDARPSFAKLTDW